MLRRHMLSTFVHGLGTKESNVKIRVNWSLCLARMKSRRHGEESSCLCSVLVSLRSARVQVLVGR